MSLVLLGTREVVTASPEETVRDVARRMKEKDVGSVVVVEGVRPVGLLTDRDIVVRLVAERGDAGSTIVRDVMSEDLVTATDGTDPMEAAWRLRKRRVRRLPLVDAQGTLVGIVTLDDLLGHLVATDPATAEMLASFHDPYMAV